MKKKGDFERVYNLAKELKEPLENIYAKGRDLSVFMSSKLKEFNNAAISPTLKIVLTHLKMGGFIRLKFLKSNSQAAKDNCKKLENVP